jgi:hypothetical protein
MRGKEKMINSPATITASSNHVERNIVVNGTHIRVKSVFNDKIPLEEALANIAKRKLAAINRNVIGTTRNN